MFPVYQSPKQIKGKEIEKLKQKNFIIDDSGKRPVAISVVMPTFNKHDKDYYKAVKNIIRILGNLIDNGVIDEVVIAEGSRKKDGSPDNEFMAFLLSAAVKYCRTFEKEVDFVRSLPEGRQKALQGRFDFSFRIQSQVDQDLHDIYINHNILSPEEVEFLKQGKGANMWLSVPVTYGDILCFVDSDIVSFREHYIKGLCRPILLDWKSGSRLGEDRSSTVYTKAAYVRQHEMPHGGFRMGGRLSRLYGIPMLNLMSRYNIFPGLEKITYPFSGEFAITRKTLNELQFSNGYDIELSMLCQLWKKYGMNRVAQYDFGFFRHLPGNEAHADDMLLEISTALFYWIRRYGLEDRLVDIETLLRDYEDTANRTLETYMEFAGKHPSRVRYTETEIELDRERINRYKRIIRESHKQSKTHEPKLLKPWEDIKRQLDTQPGYSYPTFKATVSARVNKFTSQTILSYIKIYIDRSTEIMSRFTD